MMEVLKDKKLIALIRQRLGNDLFYMDDEDEPTEECVHFYFLAIQNSEEVLCDCVLYTLRLHHESEMHEAAEARASEKFEEYIKSKDSESAIKEEEIGMMMAEILVELEEEEAIKVQEHIEMDLENAVGLGLDVGLNVPVISNEVIAKFISEFRAGAVKLDEALYSFQLSTDFESPENNE
jgi:hypothetical protein